MGINVNYQWRIKAYFTGLVKGSIYTLMRDGFTRDEAVDLIKDIVETQRQESLLIEETPVVKHNDKEA
jgi:hypothetical protein